MAWGQDDTCRLAAVGGRELLSLLTTGLDEDGYARLASFISIARVVWFARTGEVRTAVVYNSLSKLVFVGISPWSTSLLT
jgi:hypothetical protein